MRIVTYPDLTGHAPKKAARVAYDDAGMIVGLGATPEDAMADFAAQLEERAEAQRDEMRVRNTEAE